MRAIRVGNVELGAIKAVIHEKCESIGRPQLGDVSGSEIKVLQYCGAHAVCICRVRGMTYRVNLSTKKPSIATFDPVLITKDGTRARRGYSSPNENQ